MTSTLTVRTPRWVRGALFGALLAGGCATLRQVSALRQVEFTIDRVSGVRLAAVNFDRVRSLRDLGPLDAGRLAAAAARRELPLEFVVHLDALNPPENPVTARLLRFQWTLDLNGREAVSGILDTVYTFPPGVPQDVALPVRLDLWRFFETSAADAFNLAAGLAGLGARPTEVVVRAVPTIDTPLGRLRYPHAITIVRRTVGGP
jgi:hypothetical protein